MPNFHAVFVRGRNHACAANIATATTKIFELADFFANYVQSVIKEQNAYVISSLALGVPT
jgi:hypothetical protein